MCLSNKPDKNLKPDRVKPKPDFEKSKTEPDPDCLNPCQPRLPERDYLKPVTSLLQVQTVQCLWKLYGKSKSF